MIQLIVPFYKNPHLATAIGDNFTSLFSEIEELKAEIIFINDSPDDPGLKAELKNQSGKLCSLGLKVNLIENDQNLGFVKSCNRGLRIAQEKQSHALLLNSDVLLSPGCLREMLRVLNLDSMFGFVCPRSNNASIASLPFENREYKRSYEEAYANFKILSPYLKDWQIAPVAVGFCFLIRDIILVELGVLDELYSPGYNEENDICFRANRIGFSSVIANKAFAFHESSSSFGAEQYSLYDKRNRTLLLQRYPEYDRTVGEYLQSAEFKFEQLIFNFLLRHEGAWSWAVDFTHFKIAHNGTYEFGIEVLLALYSSEKRDFSLSVIGDPEVLKFHKIQDRFPSVQIVSENSNKTFDVVIKPAQIFLESDYISLAEKGMYCFVFMLDTIALDSAYIRSDSVQLLWQLLPKMADGILFISDFSKEQFNRRIPNAEGSCAQLACQLSVSQADYNSKKSDLDQSLLIELEDELSQDPLPENFFFVVGNHYEHKFLMPTIKALAKEFPTVLFVGLGGQAKKEGNVRIIKSGLLHSARIDQLYANSKAVIFPSFYEGFGFPIPKGLSSNSIVIARDSSLNQQIKDRWDGNGQLLLFKTTSQLKEIVREVIDGANFILNQSNNKSKIWNWEVFADQLIDFIRLTAAADPLAKRAMQRLEISRLLRLSFNKLAEKEQQRIDLADELHSRNLNFLTNKDRLQELEVDFNKVINSKSFKIGSTILNCISSIPGLGRFRHREKRRIK